LTEDRGIKRQIQLPISEAVRISFESLRIRFWRSIITTAGVLLGIAFLVSVIAGATITASVEANRGREEVDALGGMEEERQDEGLVSPQQIWLIAMSLIVCVVGIANSMLMAVTERFREIGTMKCLGALDRFIVELFLLESGFQGFTGAAIGALIGLLASVLMSLKNYQLDTFYYFPGLSIIVIVVISSLLGMVLSVIGAAGPSYKAAKLPPAEAMRVEV
jgi:ABC-type antimicrobial peptide transport system permease subunit